MVPERKCVLVYTSEIHPTADTTHMNPTPNHAFCTLGLQYLLTMLSVDFRKSPSFSPTTSHLFHLLPLVELFGFCTKLASQPTSFFRRCSPAAVLFFLGALFPLDFATFRCSNQSSSSSSIIWCSGYKLRNWGIVPILGG